MKRIFALTLAFLFVFSTFCFAAVSSSRSSSHSSPSYRQSTTTTPQAAPNNSYKPSAPSSSYSDKAPANQNKNLKQSQQPQQQTSSFWRNAAMFGGGMLLGSLFSHMFGFGPMGDMLAGLFSIILNIIILIGIVMLLKFIWNKIRNKDDKDYKNRY